VFELAHPELPSGFPPPRSLDAVPNNLPVQLSSFVGRERELRDVTQLLSEHTLVTLTGAGGCGKTRLALQSASEALERFPDGAGGSSSRRLPRSDWSTPRSPRCSVSAHSRG
jgi:hypothetical protein